MFYAASSGGEMSISDPDSRTGRIRPKRRGAESGIEGVGYGKPPRQYTWKPGQSGNPKGRLKGAKNESTLLREILERRIQSNSGNRRRKISVLEGILLRIAENALKGDPKSAAFLLNRFAALVSGELQPQDLSEDDRAVLDAFAQQTVARKTEGVKS